MLANPAAHRARAGRENIRAVAARRAEAAIAPWEHAREAPPARPIEGLPEGVEVRELRLNPDHRGWFVEAFRSEWGLTVDPVQWNFVHGKPGAMRGMHVHPRHWDYIVQLAGRSAVGLCDLRPGSATRGLAAAVALEPDEALAVTIPNGIAHGLLSREPSIHLYAVTDYWDPDDELPCRWDDPVMAVPWPEPALHLSEQDAEAPSASEVLGRLGWPPLG